MKKALYVIVSIILACAVLCSCEKTEETSAAEPSPEVTPTPAVKYTALLRPLSETKVIPDARGRIIKCPYEIGDSVSKGELLYEIEDNGISDNIKTTKNAVKKADITINTAEEDMDNLTVTAPASGILHNFSLKSGERVSETTIGEIVDESVIVAVVPFTAEQRSRISVGMNGVITSADLMSAIAARVTRVYDAQAMSIGGTTLYNVELTASNPGGFSSGDSVGAVIQAYGEDITSPESGSVEMKDSTAVVSRGSGNAVEVNVREGDYVTAGQVLVRMENSTVSSTLERARLDKNDLEIKLRGLEEDFADLKIYAPASGVITDKSKSLNDSVSSTSDSVMTITDMSTLTMDIDVSEEDKNRISVGMPVNVAAGEGEDIVCFGTVSDISDNERISGEKKVYAVRITVDNSSAAAAPNTMASVSFGE